MGEHHIVDDQANAALGAIVAGIAAKATDKQARDAGVLLQRAEIGHLEGVIRHPVEVFRRQLRATDDGDRQRHFLQLFVAVAGGNGDFGT